MALLLCDPGWYVPRSDQNKWDDNTNSHATFQNSLSESLTSVQFLQVLPDCSVFFCQHTVAVLVSQLFSFLATTYQCRRGVSFMIPLQHADQKNAHGNSDLATTWHTLRTYLCVKPKQTSTRREHEKNNTSTTIRQSRVGFCARAFNLARRQTICR